MGGLGKDKIQGVGNGLFCFLMLKIPRILLDGGDLGYFHEAMIHIKTEAIHKAIHTIHYTLFSNNLPPSDGWSKRVQVRSLQYYAHNSL